MKVASSVYDSMCIINPIRPSWSLQLDLSVHQTATKPSTCSFAAVPPSCGFKGATIGLEVGAEIGVLIGDDELTDTRGAASTGLLP